MSLFPIKSIFQHIAEEIFTSTLTLSEQKQIIITFVESKNINERDKKTIIYNVNNSHTLTRLQTYICNSLLQYEGLGMNQLNKQAKQEENFKNL